MSVPAQESAPRRKHRSGEFLLTASMRFEYTAAHCLGPQNDAVDGLLSFDWPRRSEQACGAFLFFGQFQPFGFWNCIGPAAVLFRDWQMQRDRIPVPSLAAA